MRQEFEMQKQQQEHALRIQELQAKMQIATMEVENKRMMAELHLQESMMDLSGKRDVNLETIKAKLAEISIKERGANDRFKAEVEVKRAEGSGI